MCVDDDECRYTLYILDKSKDSKLCKLYFMDKLKTTSFGNLICYICFRYRLGSHNCDTLGSLYKCRNTKGSFRCEKLRCGYGKILNEEEGR